MKQVTAVPLVLCLAVCIVASISPVVSAGNWTVAPGWIISDAGAVANVTFTVGSGGFLWVNGTVVSNQTIQISNQTTLVFTASPSNTNYTFSSYSINGSVYGVNPFVYTVNVPDNSSVLAVTVLFGEVPVVTASPVPDLSVDDAAGLAVGFGLLSVAVGVSAVLLLTRYRQDEELEN